MVKESKYGSNFTVQTETFSGICLTLQGLSFFWLPMVGGGVDSTPLAKISDNDAIHLKLGTLIL